MSTCCLYQENSSNQVRLDLGELKLGQLTPHPHIKKEEYFKSGKIRSLFLCMYKWRQEHWCGNWSSFPTLSPYSTRHGYQAVKITSASCKMASAKKTMSMLSTTIIHEYSHVTLDKEKTECILHHFLAALPVGLDCLCAVWPRSGGTCHASKPWKTKSANKI